MNIRRVVWYVKAFATKYGKTIAVSIVVGAILVALFPSLMEQMNVGKSTTYVGRVGLFSFSQLPRDILDQVSFGLTTISDDGVVKLALATSYRMEENGKAYRFSLPTNAHWQDGKPVLPDDVSYAFSDTEIARSANDIVFRINVKKQDENGNDPILPVSFLSLVSAPLFRQISAGNFLFPATKIVGLGAYRIISIQYKDGNISQVILDSDKDRKIYRFYPTEQDVLTAFKKGQVDVIEGLLDSSDLETWNQVRVTANIHNDEYLGLFFNLAYTDGQNAPFADKSLRQALNFAIAKTQGQDRVLSPISRKSWAYIANETDLEHFEKNIQTAVDLLVKADTPTKLSFTLSTTSSYSTIADTIVKQWNELGQAAYSACMQQTGASQTQCQNKKIEAQVRITSFPDISSYATMLIGAQIPKDPDQYILWHSTQATNITHYKNPRIDKLLEDGRQTQSEEDRRLIYSEFQRTLVKDSPVVFLEPIKTYTVERKNLL